MLELIKERWNNLQAAERSTVAILLLSALVLITSSLAGLMTSGGPRRHHLDQAPVELKRQTIELEPRLLEKSEFLEMLQKEKQLLALSKQMNEAREKSERISAALTESNKLPLNRQTGDGRTLWARVHEVLSLDMRLISIFFWSFWLLCGLAAASSAYRKLGGPPVRVLLNRLKESLQGCRQDKGGALPDISDILPKKGALESSGIPVRDRNDRSNWIESFSSWIKNIDPWGAASWSDIKLADGASLVELTERVLETADRSSHPSMRFYLSTVLKAHMFLLHNQALAFGRHKPNLRFKNPSLQLYYEFGLMGAVDFGTPSGIVILQILRLLDQHGECPSVTRLTNDSDSHYDAHSYAVLHKVPLWLHSLNVAGRLTSRSTYYGEPVSRLLIASIAHDLGKMPHIRKFETESHIEASMRVLDSIPCFESLPYAGQIRKAIREHHCSNPETFLGKKLRNADHHARSCELASDSSIENDKWKMRLHLEEFSVEPTMKNICLAIYPYFMHFSELESLRDNLTAYERSADLVKDLERIIRQPQFLFNDAFRVGAAIADIAGAALGTKNRL